MPLPEIMNAQQQRFVELRAQGASYRTIAFELRVSERTLFYWKDKLESEVHWEETVQLENLQHDLLGTRGLRARRLAKRLEQVEEELDKRSLADLSTARLFSLADGLRRELIKVTTPDKPRCTSAKKEEQKSIPLDSAAEAQSAADSPIEAECNHHANLGQSASSGHQPNTLSQDLSIEEFTQAAIHSPDPWECKATAIAVQPELKSDQVNLSPIQHQTKDFEVRASLHPPTQHSGENCSDTAINREHGVAAPSQETQDPCKNTATSGRLSPSPSTPADRNPIHCLPISPERLIGSNISFREVLAKRGQAAQTLKAL
jgi:hypothetical protein